MDTPIPQRNLIGNGALVDVAVNVGSAGRCGDNQERTTAYDPLVPTIFHEQWWLNEATGGHFEIAEVSAGGRAVGRLPFLVTRRFGMKVIRMPSLTYFLGPAIDEGEGNANTRFLKRLEITRELLQKLPRVSWLYVKCQRGITDVIAFQEQGFRTYVQFTHEIAPMPIEVLWQKMRNKTRNVIRRAEERLSIGELTDPHEFIQLYERNCALKGFPSDLDNSTCRRVISVSLERQRGRILTARNRENQIVAAHFYVWDQVSSFYTLSTRSEDSGNGAISLLIWEAIKHSARKGLIFDFAGLATEGSVLLYSGFGAAVDPRYVALRTRRLARIAKEAKSLFFRENFFY